MPSLRTECLVVFALGLVLSVAWYRHAWAHPTQLQIGIPGDDDEYDWFLSWLPWSLGHGINPLVSRYVNYPNGANMTWNTSVLLPAFIVSPLTVLFDAPFSYNVLTTLSPAVDTMLAYLAFRRWARPLPALAGALVFAFSTFVDAQSAGHLAQTILVCLPLLLIALRRLLFDQTGRWWLDGLGLGAILFAQLLISEEILAMAAVVSAIVVVLVCLAHYRSVKEKLAYAWRGAAVAIGSFLVAASPFLAYQLTGPYRISGEHPNNVYVTNLASLFAPTSFSQFHPSWATHLSIYFPPEDAAYIGVPILVVCAFALIVGRRLLAVQVAAAIFIVATVFSFGYNLHVGSWHLGLTLPDRFLQKLPTLQNLLPARFASIMFLGVGMLVALGLTLVTRMALAWRVGAWVVTLAGLVVACPTTSFVAAPAPTYPAFTTHWVCKQGAPAAVPGRGYPALDGKVPVALVMPVGNEVNLLWQSEAGFCFAMPSSTGMVGTHPVGKAVPMPISAGGNGYALPPVVGSLRRAFAAQLRQYQITEIILGPESPASPQATYAPVNQAQLVAWLDKLLGQTPLSYKEAYFVYLWPHLPPYSQIATGNFTSGG